MSSHGARSRARSLKREGNWKRGWKREPFFMRPRFQARFHSRFQNQSFVSIFYEGDTGNEFLGNPCLVSQRSRSFPGFLSLDRETSANERARAQGCDLRQKERA
jgi:hypothetical protein